MKQLKNYIEEDLFNNVKKIENDTPNIGDLVGTNIKIESITGNTCILAHVEKWDSRMIIDVEKEWDNFVKLHYFKKIKEFFINTDKTKTIYIEFNNANYLDGCGCTFRTNSRWSIHSKKKSSINNVKFFTNTINLYNDSDIIFNKCNFELLDTINESFIINPHKKILPIFNNCKTKGLMSFVYDVDYDLFNKLSGICVSAKLGKELNLPKNWNPINEIYKKGAPNFFDHIVVWTSGKDYVYWIHFLRHKKYAKNCMCIPGTDWYCGGCGSPFYRDLH